MVIYKDSPMGIDAVIKDIQSRLDAKLAWVDDITVYPKCYPVMRDGLKTIEYYYPNGQDYLNVITAEENKCFFVAGDRIEKVNLKDYSTDLELFFTLDLRDIKNGDTRRDSEVHAEVLNVLKGVPNVTIKDLITRIERVFYGYTVRIENDMQPYHCFKINLTVDRFQIDQIC